MVRILAIASATLAAVAAVSGYVVPRTNPPKGWDTSIMENYDAYHERYLALDCQRQHNTPFFTACCHPMKANETLATARPPYCNPANLASKSSSAAAPAATGDGDDGDDCDDDGDSGSGAGNDGADPTSVAPTSTAAPAAPNTPVPVPQAPVTTSADPKPTTTYVPPPPPTTTAKPTTTAAPPPPPTTTSSASSSSGGGDWITGGEATFYDQDGAAGSCGNYNPDSAKIVAVQSQRMEASLCGKQVLIVNLDNGKSVTATVQDTCPGCQGNSNSLDLSHGAFDAIADEATGVVPIKWMFI